MSMLSLSTSELERKLHVFEGDIAPANDADLVEELKSSGDYYRATKLLIPAHIRYWRRFARKKAAEKQRCAKYAFNRFFHPGFRGFVQASTTTMYLGPELAKHCPSDVHVYTNSVVLPLTALRENADHRVYAFSGSLFDEFCGGWLAPADDTQSHKRLRALFERGGTDRLRTAVLAPMAMKPESGPYFVRQEMAIFANIMLMAAEQVIVLLPADRLFPDGEALESQAPLFRALMNWKELCYKVHIVAAGVPRNASISREKLALSFEEVGVKKVHWEDPETLEWSGLDRASDSEDDITLRRIKEAQVRVGEWLAGEERGRQVSAMELCGFAIRSPYDFTDWLFALGNSVVNQRQTKSGIDVERYMELLENIVGVGRILRAFRDNPGASSQTIGSSLDWSRTTLHSKMHGIPSGEFREDEATVGWLVTRSKALFMQTLELWNASPAGTLVASAQNDPEFPM